MYVKYDGADSARRDRQRQIETEQIYKYIYNILNRIH